MSSPHLKQKDASWSALFRLGRLNMTVFSAVTYAAGATLGLEAAREAGVAVGFDPATFVLGYLFTLSCQLGAHFLGEYYDYESDRRNTEASVVTGGSKVLLKSEISPRISIAAGRAAFILGAAVLSWLPARCHMTGVLMLVVAHQYSVPPLKLNHNGLGEVGAALVMNVLLPYFAALLQSSYFLSPVGVPFHSSLAALVVPAALLKVSLFLALNMADKRADWLAGKTTVPVLIGEAKASLLLAACAAAAYASIPVLWWLGLCHTTAALTMLASAPAAARFSAVFLFRRPYKLDPLLFQCLAHAPMVVMAVFADSILRELVHVANSPAGLHHGWFLSATLRFLPLLPFISGILLRKRPPPPHAAAAKPGGKTRQVVIVGGGVGGLMLAATLGGLGVPYVVLERKLRGDADGGADLALWPSASAVLRALMEDRAGETASLWDVDSYPVKTVYMTTVEHDTGAEQILKKVDMQSVVAGLDDNFRLVGRDKLINTIRSWCWPNNVIYDSHVTAVTEDVQQKQATVATADGQKHTGCLVVGADGINSLCRRAVVGGEETGPRYGGEVCYRGLISLEGTPESRVHELLRTREEQRPESMTVSYGRRIRYSWGYLDSARRSAFWFVKQLHDDAAAVQPLEEACESWPEAVRLLALATEQHHSYIHVINDRPPLPRWSSSHLTLIGDACHAVTPNNGQGACMAIEDAFVLGVLLARYWKQPDGQVEACYQFERARRRHTSVIHGESYKQMKLGQLVHPFLVRFRELLLRAVPAKVLEKGLRKTNVFDIEPYLDEYERCRI